MAHHVADDEQDPVLVEDEHVVPVAADRGAVGGRSVARGDGCTVDLGELVGQGGPLERHRRPVLGVVAAAAGQGASGQHPHRLEERLLVLAEDVQLGVGHGEHARDVLGQQGQDGEGVPVAGQGGRRLVATPAER